MSRYVSGLEGEKQAVDYLRGLGLAIVQTRFRGGRGEADVIARDGKTLCFVEVKYRPDGMLGDGLLAIDRDKRMRMRSAALAYLQKHPTPYRLDCLEITRAGIWYVKDILHEV